MLKIQYNVTKKIPTKEMEFVLSLRKNYKMVKYSTLILLLLANFIAKAQTYYSQNFNASTALPAGYIQWNVDGKTVSPTIASDYNITFGTNAWKIFNGGANKFAISTSYYAPAAQADDWLVTPKISIPSGSQNVVLSFFSFCTDGNYPDELEVRVSLTDSLPSAFPDSLLVYSSVGSGESTSGTTHAIDMTKFAGKSVRLAFRNVTYDGVILGIDDIKLYSTVNYDIAATDMYLSEHNELGASLPIKAEFQNLGAKYIDSLAFNYSVNGGPVVSTKMKPANFSSYIFSNDFPLKSFTSATPFTTSTTGSYEIKVWCSDLNGNNIDANPANDTLSQLVFFYNANANKKVLMEEFTGAWCGFCPEGHHLMDQALISQPKLIGISIHDNQGSANADKMQVPEGLDVSNAFGSGFPSATFNRRYSEVDGFSTGIGGSPPSSGWESETTAELARLTPVNVSFANKLYDTITRQLSVDVNASFLASLKGDFRTNLYIVEDSVIGSGAGYDQKNYWCAGCGNPEPTAHSYSLLASNPGYAHQHVLRQGLGGAWGTTGVIPASAVAGNSYTKTYTATLPAAWKEKNIYLVATVQEYSTDERFRLILNAEEASLLGELPNGIAKISNDDFNNMVVYPNPSSSISRIQFDLKADAVVKASVENIMGQEIAVLQNEQMNAGIHTINFVTESLSNGIYFVKLTTNGNSITQKVVVSR